MKGIINEYRESIIRNKPSKKQQDKIIANIEEAIMEETFYTLPIDSMKKILKSGSMNNMKHIKLLVYNINTHIYNNNYSLLQCIECPHLQPDIKEEEINDFIDLLEELNTVPIIREAIKLIRLLYSELILEKKKETNETSLTALANISEHHAQEDLKKMEYAKKAEIVYKRFAGNSQKQPKVKKYWKSEIKAIFSLFNKKDLNKASKAISKDPSLILVRNKEMQNMTLLHQASMNEWIEGMELLLEYGSCIEGFVDFQADHQITPLMSACEAEKLEAAQFLLSFGANVDARFEDGKTILESAGKNYQMNVVELLLSNGATFDLKFGEGLLMSLVNEGRFESAKLLVSKGVNVNIKNYYGKTPLMFALSKRNFDAAQFFVSHGADVEVPNHDGDTLLAAAIDEGSIETAEFLVNNGADVNRRNIFYESVLVRALKMKQFLIADILIEKGADIEEKGTFNDTLLMKYIQKGDVYVVEYLISKGANIGAQNTFHDTPYSYALNKGFFDIAKLLQSKGFNIDSKLFSGETFLMEKTREGKLDIVKFLISSGADPNATDGCNETALMRLMNCDNFAEIGECLISAGADTEVKNCHGETPLVKAVKIQNVDVVRFLVSHGANVKEVNLNKSLMKDNENEMKEIIEILQK